MNSNGHGLVDPKRKGCSRKRCFFGLVYPEIRLFGDRVKLQTSEVFGVFSTALEKPRDRFMHTPGDAAVGVSLSKFLWCRSWWFATLTGI